MELFRNPFRPGAGQLPPFLAGRQKEQNDFQNLLEQPNISKNLILTGLRGVGKTVLLETLKPIAYQKGWFWAGTDLSESASVSETTLAIRILADLAPLVTSFTVTISTPRDIGFITTPEKKELQLSFDVLWQTYINTPGLTSDKLKKVLELVSDALKSKVKGIVLAYDEAQNLKDKAADKEYPLSVLLEVVQFLQRKDIPYLLVLTGLPTLFPNLIETRTYAERMFHVITLDKLMPDECKQAIMKPIHDENCPVKFTEFAINKIVDFSGGYPYFIQFFCKEAYDSYLQQKAVGIDNPTTTTDEIIRKLDSDFYAGRWSRITDRQRELLMIIAKLESADEEFTILDIVMKSKVLQNPFTSSHVNQILNKLIDSGLIFKNRHGKYSFAVPLLAEYIKRQELIEYKSK